MMPKFFHFILKENTNYQEPRDDSKLKNTIDKDLVTNKIPKSRPLAKTKCMR